jgi:hypothetical protein
MENSDLEILAIGEPFPFSCERLPEGPIYNFDLGGHMLHYFFRMPTPSEISSLQSGEAEFGLYVHGPAIFLLHRFGEMLWQDSSYSWWLVAEEARKIPTVGDGLHALLKVVMVDTETRIIVALRALTFSPVFTEELHQAILGQIERPWNRDQYEQTVRDLYERHTTIELVKRASIFCKGGE